MIEFIFRYNKYVMIRYDRICTFFGMYILLCSSHSRMFFQKQEIAALNP